MAIKSYQFDYNVGDASAEFTVDTSILTAEEAKDYLAFFTWDYDQDNDPIEELMKQYALTAIRVATAENLNTYGVKSWFKQSEGFPPLDGSYGIMLTEVDRYEFDTRYLDLEIKEITA
ncbi:DUF2528 family protein [Sphingobacterium spiritivorum]|uniref:DUF2528 family protein n=1 Tax=Sphingobacterium spiritivorum TaxID=258 RepID=UPI003F76EFE7